MTAKTDFLLATRDFKVRKAHIFARDLCTDEVVSEHVLGTVRTKRGLQKFLDGLDFECNAPFTPYIDGYILLWDGSWMEPSGTGRWGSVNDSGWGRFIPPSSPDFDLL